MRIGHVRLVKKQTNDGALEFEDNVEVGRLYVVDMDSIRQETIINPQTKAVHVGKIVNLYPVTNGWIPFECVQVVQPS